MYKCQQKWKVIQNFLIKLLDQKLKIRLPSDPTTPFLDIHLKEISHYLKQIPALSCSLQHHSQAKTYE